MDIAGSLHTSTRRQKRTMNKAESHSSNIDSLDVVASSSYVQHARDSRLKLVCLGPVPTLNDSCIESMFAVLTI